MKKQRIPRKLKKRIRSILKGKVINEHENYIVKYLRFKLKTAYDNGVISLNSKGGMI